MTVEQLLEMEIDIDVCDDYDERLYLAYVGPMKLTDAGFKRFRKALCLPVVVDEDRRLAVVHTNDSIMRYAENQTQIAHELFTALAGYCADEDYNKWFEEPEGYV